MPAAPLERLALRDAFDAAPPYPGQGQGTKPARVVERLVVAEGAYLTYDLDRQLIRKETRGRTWAYRYDAAGRLREVTTPEQDVVRFGYDPLGRRTQKTWTSADGRSTRTTHFVWDGDLLLGEESEQEVYGRRAEPRVREYLYEEGSFAPLAVLGKEDDLLLETDGIGTPRAAYSRSTGEVVWEGRFGAWGEVRGSVTDGTSGSDGVEEVWQGWRPRVPPAEEVVPFRFQGQYADAETGLCYNRFRYYDPEIRGYTTPDPIGLEGGEQPLNYVGDPTGWIDPYGLSQTCGQKVTWVIRDKFAPGSYESRQLRRFVRAWNEQIAASGGSMTRRSLTAAEERASAAWKKMLRRKYPNRFQGKVVGHTPDAAAGGPAAGGRAMALDPRVNASIGGQVSAKPVGYTYHEVVVIR